MWFFRTMARSEVNQDPVEGEFFAPEEGYAAALVRESIQNMLDNRANGNPVHARFAFGTIAGSEHTILNSTYLRGLHAHLQALGVPYRPQSGEPLTYLVVEDSGTRGLCGDETHHSDAQHGDEESKNDFYYFWRNVGRSKKETTDRGRWGLGKTVFPASSRVLSFFGLTRRLIDGRVMMMGQCVGKIHEISGEKFAAYGYFAKIESDGFALPFERSDIVASFAADFDLRREEPGLSVVVPFPHADLTHESIVQEVVRNYFLPILFGELTVTIESAVGTTSISKENIALLGEQLDEPTQQMIDFAQAVLAEPTSNRIALNVPPAGEPPAWGSDVIFSSVDMPTLRKRFDAGNLVSLRVPITVALLSTGERKTSYFDMYLQRDGRLERGRGDFVRQGLSITGIDRRPKGAVRGLVIVSDAPLSALLGDSEGPAHTRWEERRDRVKRYQYGSFTVRFVSRALLDVSEILSMPETGIDEDALIDVFFLPEPEERGEKTEKTSVTSKKGPRVPPNVLVDADGKLAVYDVRQLQGGFRIAGIDGHTDVPDLIRVEVGYATDSGSSTYSPFDFDLARAPLSVVAEGASYKASGNVLEIGPTSKDFSVTVLGFDANRDLDINAKS